MGTGLIFAAVIAVWVAYGVPLALRRYDEASRAGSVSSFSGAMRVLTHRHDLATTPTDSAPDDRVEVSAKPRPSARVAARRRRRTLITLLAASGAVGGAAAYGLLPLWSIAAPIAVVLSWLVACRVQVRHERGLGRRRLPRLPRLPGRRTTRPARPRIDEDEEVTVVISGQVADHEPHRRHVMEDAPLRPEDLLQPEIAAVPMSSASGATLWDPVPVTLPTYVTKPRANRTIRTIEFGEPGAWTSGRVDGENAEQPAAAAETDSHRRAVGD